MTAMRTMGLAPVLQPEADVAESACGYVVRLPVDGFAKDELEVEVSDHLVTVRGDQQRTPADTEAFLLHERLEENFKLPADADTSALTANYAHGVLVLQVPRSPHLSLVPRRVPVERPLTVNPDASGV
jgi:HSP20 family molecular chaperone IbpA